MTLCDSFFTKPTSSMSETIIEANKSTASSKGCFLFLVSLVDDIVISDQNLFLTVKNFLNREQKQKTSLNL